MIYQRRAWVPGTETLTQAFRFGVTGLAATVLHGLVYLVAAGSLDVSPFRANLLGYAVSMPLAFSAHFLWSFRTQTRGARSGDLAMMVMRFLAINAAGFCLNSGIVWLINSYLKLHAVAAVPVMATLTPAVTFVLSRFWGFQRRSEKSE